jgi:hypothetical protein
MQIPRNAHPRTDMASSDTSETTPLSDPVRHRPPEDAAPDHPDSGPAGQNRLDVGGEGENGGVDLARVAWLVTVLACVITIVILMVEGYYGYALVTLAVAVSAGINLT